MDKRLFKYWKHCLLDAERRSRNVKKEAQVILTIGDRIPEFIRQKDILVLFPDKKSSEEKRKVQIAPCVLLPDSDNEKVRQSAFMDYPFFIAADLMPNGTLCVPEKRLERIPIFIRKFLEPNASNDRTIASLEEVDRLLSNFDDEETDWKAYWKACEALFCAATGKTFAEMNVPDVPEIVVLRAQVQGMSQNILKLYDKLLDSNIDLPLLDTLISCECEPLLPLPHKEAVFTNREHLAQMNCAFPLSISQRETLAMYTAPNCSRIFAVNGPPGTGKTTFLQTVIANRLVHAVLAQKDPEIIVASSANNQAITNILKDFKVEKTDDCTGTVALSERWLPDLDTLGMYLSGREDLSDKYAMMLTTAGKGFPNSFDNPEHISRYRSYYLEHFNEFFNTSFQDELSCQHFLYKQMHDLNSSIEEGLDAALQRLRVSADGRKSFLGKLKEKLCGSTSAYDRFLIQWERHDNFVAHYNRLLREKEYMGLSPDADMAVRLDISYRCQLFWYAIHYREAEFIHRLSLCSGDLSMSTQSVYLARLRRLACVLPVFISTFHSLPKYMTCTDDKASDTPLFNTIDLLIVDESGQVSPELAVPSFSLARQAILVGDVEQIEPIWSVSEIYSLINLQRFGLISSESDALYGFLAEHGFLSSSGSIMKMARKCCNYQVAGQRGAFLKEHRRCLDTIIAFCNDYVYHGLLVPLKGNTRKCESIPPKGYVHVNGISVRGKNGSRYNNAEAEAIVSWIVHERMTLETAYGKSVDQVIAVVTPFKEQERLIRSLLSDSSDEDSLADITVGTVHALQGAQFPVVIFSPVNSVGDAGSFMEAGGKYNMLNVAVSRAQYHFLVFGNMNIFHSELDTPAGNLAKWLFDSPETEISNNFIYQASEPLCRYSRVDRLSTLDAHVTLLRQAFQTARNRVLLVSPFISSNAILNDGLLTVIAEAVVRGVEVVVYTDYCLDRDVTGNLRPEAEKGRQLLIDNHVRLVVLKGIHNKTLVIDNRLLSEGSFNWLSASRNRNTSRYECSILLHAPSAGSFIADLEEGLAQIEVEADIFKPFIRELPCPGFFTSSAYNICTEEILLQFGMRVNKLGIHKETVSANTRKIREQYPRHGELWTDEELQIVQDLMTYTNKLDIFSSCLQRSPNSILYKVEGDASQTGSLSGDTQ